MTDLPVIAPLDRSAEAALWATIAGKAKPPGALGRIESLAVELALIQSRTTPSAARAILLVFAGDHGMTEAGVSSYPATVTTAMVETFLAGKASANAFARAVGGVEVRVVDAGVASDLPPRAALIDAKVAKGTRNAAEAPAMSEAELSLALDRGAQIARQAVADGADVVILGEMGIGNTASAALIMHRLAPARLDLCVGLGAGHSPEGLARKRAIINAAAARSDVTDAMGVLTQFGGFEIAMMAGAILGAAAVRAPVLIDGFICTSAALAAVRLEPKARDYLLFTHRSAEAGHRRMLEAMEAEPLLDLDLRLGEGTGALLALPLVRAAAALLNEVASLDDVLSGNL